MFTLAHISDLHLGPLPPVSAKALMGKRILGYLSWQRLRRKIHRPEVLTALGADIAAHAPDHIAVTGDLTNISLPDEFVRTARWLEELGSAEDISVVPGNHDAYVAMSWDHSWHHWRNFMTCEAQPDQLRTLGHFDQFPYLRRRGPVALIGLSTAHPTAPFLAGGSLGQEQLDRLDSLLAQLGEEDCCRIILLHHPPDARQKKRRKALWDSKAFLDCVAERGAELILHGHQHRFRSTAIETRSGPAQIWGVPSASASAIMGHPQSHYHIYGVERRPDAWHIEVTVRGFAPEQAVFQPGESHSLSLPRKPKTNIENTST